MMCSEGKAWGYNSSSKFTLRSKDNDLIGQLLPENILEDDCAAFLDEFNVVAHIRDKNDLLGRGPGLALGYIDIRKFGEIYDSVGLRCY